MTSLMVVALTLMSPPQFTVENKIPAFQVTNLTPPAPAKVKAAPAVAAPRTFRSGGYNASHNCPSCGRYQPVVSGGRANSPGHTHTCPGCGTSWWH